MQGARMLGNYVEHLAMRKGLSISDLGEILKCSDHQVYSLIKGRAYASFPQILELSKALNTSVEALLAGDEVSYNASVVHCMNQFKDPQKREIILDIIDDYIDIIDAVNNQ